MSELGNENSCELAREVEDKSNSDKTERVVLHGTQEEIITPSEKPFILRSGAVAGCDASLLLEIAADGTTYAAVSHWEPTDSERNEHSKIISGLSKRPKNGLRFAALISGTIIGLKEAEETNLYQNLRTWNDGNRPDLIYIPFEKIDWMKITDESLYQLCLATKVENGEIQTKISVPGTKYAKIITPQALQKASSQEPVFVRL